jgi:large subunit ribosomal protein L21
MYAVIETGGKQYKVQPGDIVQIEKLEGEIGSAMKFSNVLLVAKPGTDSTVITLGKPLLSGASVDGEIVGQGRGDKVTIVKMKRRKQYRRTQGHRQFLTQVLVTGVANGSDKAELSSTEKNEKVSKFVSLLKPKGLAFSPKRLGSRKRLGAKIAAEAKSAVGKSGAEDRGATAKPKTTKKASTKKA